MAMRGQLPQQNGDRERYDVQIDIKKAYISGICVMLKEDDVIKASVINEFGVSATDFTYANDKITLVNLMKQLDKWYIRRTLRKDLRNVMHNLQEGKEKYENTKYNITYNFSLQHQECAE